jgi:hypothetical protein
MIAPLGKIKFFLFTDFPLGNPFGKPWDKEMQSSIIDMALALLQYAWQGRTTVQTPFTWSEDEKWRKIFMHTSENQLKEYKKYTAAQ